MRPYSWIALGGATGAVLRAIISDLYSLQFSFHIVGINIVGSFFLAIIFTYFSANKGLGQDMRWLLGTGLMGGFTTMSTFSLDVAKLLASDQAGMAALYVLISLLGGLLATFIGVKLIIGREGEE
jgi:CrcB protein